MTTKGAPQDETLVALLDLLSSTSSSEEDQCLAKVHVALLKLHKRGLLTKQNWLMLMSSRDVPHMRTLTRVIEETSPSG